MADLVNDEPKLHIFLRNLIRDRTCGSVEQLQKLGGGRAIAAKLGVNQDSGVVSGDVQRRRQEYGTNAPPPAEAETYLAFLLDAFSDFTVLMLCAAAVVSLVLAGAYERTASSFAEGVAILVSVMIVTNVTAFNDYRKQQQFMRLNATVEDVSVRCIRDGLIGDVRAADLVCGDVVQLAVGDIFAADGLLIKGDGVSTDESALTGEPKLIHKNVTSMPYLLSGTKVMEGSGLFLVIAVGVNSEAGQINELIRIKKKQPKADAPPKTEVVVAPSPESPEPEEDSSSTEKSVLTAKLDRIALLVGYMASFLATSALIVMIISYSIQTYVTSNSSYVCAFVEGSVCGSADVNDYASDPTIGFPLCGAGNTAYPCCSDVSDGAELLGSPCGWMKSHAGEYLSFLVTAITILVVAIPEGLPLAVTLSLAFSVRKMQDQNNLVKHLDACETMGSATTICSDKTGTLTKNRMTVVRSLVGDPALRLTLKDVKDTPLRDLIALGISLSGSADIQWNASIKMWDQIGSKTECALLAAAQDSLGVNYKELRKEHEDHVVKRFPFSSAAKKSSFVLARGTDFVRIYTVGASEIVLDQCTSFVTKSDGTVGQLSLPSRTSIEKNIQEFASHAMRTLCLAYKDVPSSINLDSVTADESGMVFACLVGIEDPLRDEVPVAIEKCNRAGVQVKMVTGDNLDTAIAIARNCNIIRECDLDEHGELMANVAMTGPDFRRKVLDKDGNVIQGEIDKIWPRLRVLARSSPTDKYNLVTGMIASKLRLSDQNDRQVVAVTGDGTNDAPALKKADVGFAMGITGTAVARDAADIILMDDNFASIVVACKWGRNVYDSIAKFLQFQLTVNVVAVTIALEGAFIYNESPIGAVQMLWVNLIMDALASLALATEPPTDALLNRLPHGRNSSVLSSIMKWNILGQAVFQLTVLNLIFFFGPDWFDIPSGVGHGHDAPPSQHYTLMFNALVAMQLTNQINSRRLYHELNVFKGLFANMYFVTILSAEAVLQVIFVQFGGRGVGTESLPLWLWGISLGIALGSFPVQWLIVFLRKLCVRPDQKVVYAGEGPIVSTVISAGVDSMASIISPLPGDTRKPPSMLDLEEAARPKLEATRSAQNLGRLSKQNSLMEDLRSYSAKNFKELASVEKLQRTKTGGFKNPKRQAATNERFKKMYSFDNSKAQFLEAALQYKKNT